MREKEGFCCFEKLNKTGTGMASMEHYLAFISYRHIRPDQQVSALLRRHLETWHLPASCPLPRKRKVFRDTDELPTSSDLGSDIDRALQASDWLIAVCSESYVTSRWCMREIDVFIESGRKDRILPVLISGTPETAIPPQLRGIAPVLDLRESSGADGGTADPPARWLRRDLYAKIPALMEAMSGTKAAEIAASERRFRTATRFGIAAAAAAVLFGLTFYTLRTADRIAENNRKIAEATEEARQAEQEALAQRNQAYLGRAFLLSRKAEVAIEEGDDLTAIRLALEALPEDPASGLPVSRKAVSALRMALVMPDKQRHTYHPATAEDLIENNPSLVGILSHNFDSVFSNTMAGMGYTDFLSDEYMSFAAWGDGRPLTVFKYPNLWSYPLVKDRKFIPRQAWGGKNKLKAFAAWDGETLAVFQYEDGPQMYSLFEIEMNGAPKTVLFSPSGELMAVIGPDGVLALYHSTDGPQMTQPDGKYLDCLFYDKYYLIYTLSEEGELRLINAASGDTRLEMKTPSPVRDIAGERIRGQMLALCEDCVVVLDQEDGDLLCTLPVAEGAVDVEWSEPLDGSRFTVTYEDREELYALDTAEQTDSPVSTSLVSGQISGGCYKATYSSDGEWICLEDRSGNLSRWNARTGQLEWISQSSQDWTSAMKDLWDFCPLSADESCVWRQFTTLQNIDLEKIDAGTGEMLYRTDLRMTEMDQDGLLEWPQAQRALVKGKSGERRMVMFDTGSGELIWARGDLYGYTAASGDGTEILCLRAESAEGLTLQEWKEKQKEETGSVTNTDTEAFLSGKMDLVCYVLSVRTGETLERKVLMTLDRGIEGKMEAFDAGGLQVLVEEQWIANLQTGEAAECAPETLDAFREQETLKQTACTFGGQDASVVRENRRTCLRSRPGDEILFDAGSRSLAVAPDGASMVMYAQEFSPILIWAAETETLMEEGRKRLAGVQ